MMQRHETLVWTAAQVLAWVTHHVDQGHSVRLGNDPEDDVSMGAFVCGCGLQINVRPVVSADPLAGLYAVTGAAPLETPPPRVLAADVTVPVPRVTVSLQRAHRRVRVGIGTHGTCVELAADDARTLAQALVTHADQLAALKGAP
jgi:hypothetical protein